MQYIKVNNYSMKCRLYPNKTQQKKIEDILYGLRVAYNTTAYEMTQKNSMICNPGKKDPDSMWPDPGKAWKKQWLDELREKHEIVNCIPPSALSGKNGIMLGNLKKSYENFHPDTDVQAKTRTGKPKFTKSGKPVMKKTEKPVEVSCDRWKPTYYSNKHPKMSFFIQVEGKKFSFPEGSKSVKVDIGTTKKSGSMFGFGQMKIRGWRFDLLYGEDQKSTFMDCFSDKKLSVFISKDKVGDYYISVRLPEVWLPVKSAEKQTELGVDVGVHDIAITSDGVKYENKKFAAQEAKHKKALNKRLSRRQGWSNIKFREAHKENKNLVPSKRYEETKIKLAKLERKIARRRENYNHCVTADIASRASFVGIESLSVKDMMQNKHMANALSDAAMYDVLSKLKYKMERQDKDIYQIGRWNPSSQLCHVCGYQNKKVKDTSIRDWTCPECNTWHDRDINAAINILNMAKAKQLKAVA